MTKTELINQVAEDTGLTKIDAGKALDATINTIVDAIKDNEKVTLTGFGTFMASERKSRVGRNPRTGEPVNIPAAKVPKFIAGKGFKEAEKKKKSALQSKLIVDTARLILGFFAQTPEKYGRKRLTPIINLNGPLF